MKLTACFFISTVPQSAIIFLGFLGLCLVVVFIIYKLLHSNLCNHSAKATVEKHKVDYVELGQSTTMTGGTETDEFDGLDFTDTTASEKESEHEDRLLKTQYIKSKSLGDLYSKEPSPGISPRKLTQWERPSIEAVKALSHMTVLTAYGDTATAQRAKRKPRESRGDVNCVAKLQVSVGYAPTANRLEVTIIRVQDFPDPVSGNSATSSMSVHLTLLPTKRYRFKTKTRATTDVTLNETFLFRGVTETELMDSSLRFRIYSQGGIKKGKLLGEIETHLTDFDLDDVVSTMWIMVPPSEELKKLLKQGRK